MKGVHICKVCGKDCKHPSGLLLHLRIVHGIKEKRPPMRNITINIPEVYDTKIDWLIQNRLTASRSEAIRTAIREFLQKEYDAETGILALLEVK